MGLWPLNWPWSRSRPFAHSLLLCGLVFLLPPCSLYYRWKSQRGGKWAAWWRVAPSECFSLVVVVVLLLVVVWLESACWWHQASGVKDNVVSIRTCLLLFSSICLPRCTTPSGPTLFFVGGKIKPFSPCTRWSLPGPGMPTGISGKINCLFSFWASFHPITCRFKSELSQHHCACSLVLESNLSSCTSLCF